jgi:hypothetical protein
LRAQLHKPDARISYVWLSGKDCAAKVAMRSLGNSAPSISFNGAGVSASPSQARANERRKKHHNGGIKYQG